MRVDGHRHKQMAGSGFGLHAPIHHKDNICESGINSCCFLVYFLELSKGDVEK
jgi:hypothetical protein